MWTIDNVMSKGVISSKLAPETVSTAIAIGKDLRKEEGGDVIETIAWKYTGKFSSRGVMNGVEESEKSEFTFDCSFMKGSREFDGRTSRVGYKNVNMVGWLDEQVKVTVPGVIALLNEDGDVVLNQTLKVDDIVAVVVLPAPAQHNT